MRFVIPKTELYSVTYNNITYSVEYYAKPITQTGVIDEPYPNWDGTPIAKNAFVIIPELKKKFKSVSDNNTSFPLENTEMWEDYGPINSYKELAPDEFIGSSTEGENIVREYDFSGCDTLAFIDIEYVSFTVELTNNYLNEIVYTKTYESRDLSCHSFGEYYGDDIKTVTREIIKVPELHDSTLKITFEGPVKIGTSIFNKRYDLGATIKGSILRGKSDSLFETNPISGFQKIIRYGKVRIFDGQIYIENGTEDEWNKIVEYLDMILDKNILWLPTIKDRFSQAILIGSLQDWEVPIDNESFSSPIQIIGVNK